MCLGRVVVVASREFSLASPLHAGEARWMSDEENFPSDQAPRRTWRRMMQPAIVSGFTAGSTHRCMHIQLSLILRTCVDPNLASV